MQAGGDVGFSRDVAVIGGCGHVGWPLGLAFADRGMTVTLFDVNADAVERVNNGQMVFDERDADAVLGRIAPNSLVATTDPVALRDAEHIIVVVGTPVDEHLNPEPQAVP